MWETGAGLGAAPARLQGGRGRWNQTRTCDMSRSVGPVPSLRWMSSHSTENHAIVHPAFKCWGCGGLRDIPQVVGALGVPRGAAHGGTRARPRAHAGEPGGPTSARAPVAGLLPPCQIRRLLSDSGHVARAPFPLTLQPQKSRWIYHVGLSCLKLKLPCGFLCLPGSRSDWIGKEHRFSVSGETLEQQGPGSYDVSFGVASMTRGAGPDAAATIPQV